MGELNTHWYPLQGGADSTTIPALLSDDATIGSLMRGPYGYAHAAQVATSAGLRWVVREGNSANGGGRVNVTDTLAAALWSMDAIYSVAAVGGTAWIPNTGTGCGNATDEGTPYAAFCADIPDGANPALGPYSVRAPFYGIVAAARAVLGNGGNGGQLLNTTYAPGGDPLTKVWATRRAVNEWDGLGSSACSSVLNLSVINKNLLTVPGQPGPAPQPSTTATVCLPITSTCGTPFLERMSASAGAAAKDGIQLAGQTFDGTSSGTPQGTLTREPLQAAPAGACAAGSIGYSISVPAETAAIAYLGID